MPGIPPFMMTANEFLNHEFARRQRKNPHYSLRAFARDLALSPGTVSRILKNERAVPKRSVEGICKRLGLSPRAKNRFYAAFNQASVADAGASTHRRMVEEDEDRYRILAEWEHYAVLTALEIKGRDSRPERLAERLGISAVRVRDVIGCLERAGLVRVAGEGKTVVLSTNLTTSEDVSSAALKAAHHEELQLAANALDRVDLVERDFSSVMLRIHPRNISLAKKMIRNFRRDLCDLIETEDATEVYQMNVQFYPITRGAGRKNRGDLQ